MAPDNTRTQRLSQAAKAGGPPTSRPMIETGGSTVVLPQGTGHATGRTEAMPAPPLGFGLGPGNSPDPGTPLLPNVPQELELELETEDDQAASNVPSRFISSPGFRLPQGVSVSFPKRQMPRHPPPTLPGSLIDIDEEIGESTQTTPSPFSGPQPPPRGNPYETSELPPSYADSLRQLPERPSTPQPGRPLPPDAHVNPMFAGEEEDDGDDFEDTVVASKEQRDAQLSRSAAPKVPRPETIKPLDQPDLEGEEESTFVAGPKKRPDSGFRLTPPDEPLPTLSSPAGSRDSLEVLEADTQPKSTQLVEKPVVRYGKAKPNAAEHTLNAGLETGEDDEYYDEDDEGPTRRLNPDQADELRQAKDQLHATAPDSASPQASPRPRAGAQTIPMSEGLADEGDTLRGRLFVPPAHPSAVQRPEAPLPILETTPPSPQSPSPSPLTPASNNPPQSGVDRLIGHKFGNFRIDEKIGFGGFGNIYRATQLFLQQPIAVKVLHVDLQENTEVLARFRREAQALAQLRHDNIVQLSDFGLIEGLGFYIAMEFLEGESIHNRIKAGETFSLPRIKFITEEICRVLGYVHQKGVIHRDMKPSNIILYEDDVRGERLKLIDFGIAAIQGAAMAITKVGSNLGTVRYMSPEQMMGSATLDGRSDLYSVATILFRMLTDKMPFSAENDPTLMHQKINSKPRKLTEARPDKRWAPELVDFFQSALAKAPADRPDDAAHFWQKIEIAFSAQEQSEGKQTGFDLVQAFNAPPPPSAAMPVDLGPAFPADAPGGIVSDLRKTNMDPVVFSPTDLEGIDERELMGDASSTVATPSLKEMPTPPSSSRKSWLIFTAILLTVLAVGGAGLWWYWQQL